MTAPLRLGIIGAGFIGRAHARFAKESDLTELVAVADLDASRGESAARDFGGRWYRDYEQMLARDDLQAVVIATPDHLHLEPVRAAARAGKHILLEKPLATTLTDADEILGACDKHSVRLMVGHSLRFSPPYLHMRHLLLRGDIGAPVHAWARRNGKIVDGTRFGGNTSVVLFLAVHDIDFLLWCTGTQVVRVHAESNRRVLSSVGVDDSVLSLLKFANGFVASLEHSWIHPVNFPGVVDAKMQITGEKGALAVDALNQGLAAWTESGVALGGPSEHLGQLRGSIYEQDRHFVECLRTGKAFLVSGAEARSTLRVALAIHDSLKRGAPVGLTGD